jgi:hypothetical protein
MQTLTIPIPDGFEIDSLDKNTGTLTLREKPKDIIERIQSVSDAIACLGQNDEEVILLHKLIAALPNDSHPVNYQKAIVLTKVFNEGWLPDWDNTNQLKYYPYFEMGGSSGFRYIDCDNWRSLSNVGSRLCFKSAKLAEHAGKKFTAIYKQFMLIK